MVLFPEREKPSVPEVTTPPETPHFTETVEKAGVTPIPTQFTAQVTDDSGNNVIQPTAVTLSVPADDAALATWSKGSIASSLTWFASFWLRLIKKAIHLGVRIIKPDANPS